MQTLTLNKPGTFLYENREPPGSPQAHEALVKVRRVGICGTDLHAFKGNQPFFSYPRVLGHELAVEVLETGRPLDDLKPGDYCTVEPYLNCGTCTPCQTGRSNCCSQLSVLGVHEDGGMCEFMKVPVGKLHSSSALPLEHLALVEMLTIGAHAVGRAGVLPEHRVAVVGAGPIGLSAIQFSKLAGADPVVIEIDELRRTFCREILEVTHTIDAAGNPMDALRDRFDGELPDVVFDATGNSSSMHRAFEYVGSGGTLVLIGLIQGDISFYNPEFHCKEMTLLSSRNATSADFEYVIRMLESGNINLTPWITHRTPFEKAATDFPSWLNRDEGVIKAMIDLD